MITGKLGKRERVEGVEGGSLPFGFQGRAARPCISSHRILFPCGLHQSRACRRGRRLDLVRTASVRSAQVHKFGITRGRHTGRTALSAKASFCSCQSFPATQQPSQVTCVPLGSKTPSSASRTTARPSSSTVGRSLRPTREGSFANSSRRRRQPAAWRKTPIRLR